MKNSNNNSNTKLILLHPYIQKQGGSSRFWLLAFVSFFTFAFLLTLIYTRETLPVKSTTAMATGSVSSPTFGNINAPLPTPVINTLLHYASRSNDSFHMSHAEIKPISDVLRKCSSPCNFLVFGLTHETLLWKALNHNGRTVFIEENRYYAAYYEELHPEIDVFDVQYTTKMEEMRDLIASTKKQIKKRVQASAEFTLLGVGDGPEGPGRMAPIFTAGVLARNKKASNAKTHIFVHDYYRNVERIYGDEFLCRENLVESNDMLAHFVVEKMDENSFQFCSNKPSTSSS
ncbi:PROTEIN IRREGULAR XYLEM 15 [Salix viminalis]|uniref:PROTEIN IRREGULAR XYLEM 15 n=1 Tax=Salix viminalis TaxID=40686 RepID=A0A9Q0NYS7_SALVM|nr:PROTEIN IRREGULAR XYLEM 15 [Salix viminalis]